MNGKIIIAILFSSLFILIMPSNIVSSAPFTYYITFESGTSGYTYNYNDGFLNTFSYYANTGGGAGTHFNVVTSNPHDLTKSFEFNGGPTDNWFNFNYPSYAYMTSISFWIKPNYDTGLSGGGYFALTFDNMTTWKLYSSRHALAYDNFLSADRKLPMIILLLNTTTSSFYTNGGTTSTVFGVETVGSPHVGDDLYRKIFVNITTSTGECTYTVLGRTPVSSYVNNVSQIIGNKRIDCIGNTGVTNSNNLWYLDDFNVTISETYPNIPVVDHDFSLYKTLGNFPDVIVMGGGTATNEQRYENFLSGTLYGLDIFTYNTYNSSFTTMFNTYVNGVGYLPSSLYNYTFGSSDCVAIRYDFVDYPILIEDEKILLEVYNPYLTSYGSYYGLVLSSSATMRDSADVDGDGDSEFKKSSLPNGNYDGTVTVGTSEFFYVLYYLGSAGENPENETTYNYLTISGKKSTNTSGSPLFYKNDTVSIGWGISDLTVTNRINIKKSGTNVTTQGFPYTIANSKGTKGFSAESVGNYTVYLFCNNIQVRRKYFDVVANPVQEENDYQIHSIPPITYDYAQYTVSYNYHNPSGYVGYIAVFRHSYDTYDFSKNIYNRSVNANVSGATFIYTPKDTEFNDYWQLFVKIGSSYYPKGNYHLHGIIQSGKVSSIALNTGTTVVNHPITVFGFQPYLLQEVYIYVNNYKWKNVGYSQDYTEIYTPKKKGTYLFELKLVLDNGTTYTLCDSVSCIVTGNETAPPETPEGLEFLPPPYSYIMGAIITIALMILPSIALGKVGISGSESLKYVPIFSGTMGFILSCLIGFFPWYSIFALLFVLILIIVVLYLSKNKQ